MTMLACLEGTKRNEAGANLEGRSNPGIEVVRSDLWRNSLGCLALYVGGIGKHTLELLDIAFCAVGRHD